MKINLKMKNLYFVVIMLLICVGAMSQEITVRFTGQLNGANYCQLDSVLITNTTRGWSETIVYPDTIIVLGSMVNISNEETFSQGLGQNVPNPFNCETSVELTVSQQENVVLQLLDASGKIYTEYKSLLEEGSHKFNISAANPQTYILNAIVGKKNYSIRMVNVGSGCANFIKYAGASAGLVAKLTSTNEFHTGDQMEYIGYTTIENNVVTSETISQVQTENQDFIFEFAYTFAPDVETLDATDITGATASLYGEITTNADSIISEKGFFYGIDENELINHVIADSNFNVTLTDLLVNTTYYFKAYVTYSTDTIYGETRSFRTRGNTLNEYEFVDLGLPSGKSWATCNVGANNPEEFGNYYAWGEISVKDEYSWDNYIYGSATYDETYQAYTDVHITKYNNVSAWGSVDNKYTLEDSDDVANLTRGTGWRIPTKDEINELKDNCTWTWTTINDVYGYLVTGPNENSIFLPAAGYGGSESQNEYGIYWSSSLNEESVSYGLGAAGAYNLYFYSSDITVRATFRVYGFSIRPICNENSETPHLPTVTTTAVNTITDVSAFSGGNITYDGGATVTARGVCWSTTQYPTTSDNHTSDGICFGEFTSSISGLTAGQTYYARAYATNRAGTAYGEQFCFTTSSVHNENGGTLNEHEYINLGLPSGTLWATCNVGANVQTDFGNYFAWAETSPKSRYESSNYSLYYENHFTSYNNFDQMTQLQFSNDAATVNWGYGWRTPTYEEINELVTSCTWTWTTINNVTGSLVTGPNGNTIFLPAAGWWLNTDIAWYATAGCYWSSTIKDDYNYDPVWILYFNSEGSNTSEMYRSNGLIVRPVRQ